MKVSNKTGPQNQAATNTEFSLTSQPDVSDDFFSTLIASLLSAPVQVVNEQAPETEDGTAASSDIQPDGDQFVSENEKPIASSHPASELITKLLNASIMPESFNLNKPAVQEPVKENNDNDVLTRNNQISQTRLNMPRMEMNTQINNQEPLNNELLTQLRDLQKNISEPHNPREEHGHPERGAVTLSSTVILSEAKDDSAAQGDSAAYEHNNKMRPVMENVFQAQIDNQKQNQELNQELNQKPNKLPDYQEIKHFKINRDTQSQQTQQTKPMKQLAERLSQHYLFDEINIDTRPQTSPDQIISILSREQGKVDDAVENKSHYVDALVQMSEIINSQTSQRANQEQPIDHTNTLKQDDYSNYAAALKNVNQPGYELKIELLPQALDLSGKETWQANIKIHPPELGAVIAKLKIDKNSAELVIVAENNQVKGIVEANLSQLRDNFQKHDINITNIHIDVQNPHSGAAGDHGNKDQRPQEYSDNKEQDAHLKKQFDVKKEVKQRINSLIDTYA